MFASSNFIALVFVFLSVNAEVTITPDYHEIISKENENLTFICKSDERIDWITSWEKFPSLKYAIHEWNGAEAFLYWSSAKLIDRRYVKYNFNESDKSYEATLHLYNVTHESVGYYFCAKESFKFPNPLDLLPKAPNEEGGADDVKTNVAHIYVNVEVANNKPLFSHSRRIDSFEEDNCPVLIPCPPSNEKQTTKLVLIEKNGTQLYFNPTPLDDYPNRYELNYWNLGRENNFVCLVNGSEQSKVDVRIHRNRTKPEPFNRSDQFVEISSKTGTNFVERDQIELTCIYNNKTKGIRALSVQWILPNNNLAEREGRTEQSDTCIWQGNKKIIVKNLTANDMGTYKCVIKFKNVVRDVTAEINITNMYDADQPLLMIPSGVASLTSNLNAAEELLFIRYVANNSTKFRIEYTNIFNSIGSIQIEDDSKEDDMSLKMQAVNIRSRRLIKVMIRNVTFSDNANYTVIAENGSKTANVTIELVVRGKPVVNVDKIEINDNGNITGKCHVTALPPPSKVDVTVMKTNGLILGTQSFYETNIRQSYEFSFELKNVPVRVRCTATNENGSITEFTPEIIENALETIVVYACIVLLLAFAASMLLNITYSSYIKKGKPIVKFKIIEKFEQIGSGEFGEVHRALVGIYDPSTKSYKVEMAAIKTLIGKPHYKNIKGMDQLLTELIAVSQLEKHDNVVRFIGAISDNILNGYLVLIFEYCEGPNLKKFLCGENPPVYIDQIERTDDGYRINQAKTETDESIARQDEPRKYTTTDLLDWASQIANGLIFLAKMGISHCDLAARNIIMCNHKTVKICDFGMAQIMTDDRKIFKPILSPRWMAPEVLKNHIINEKSDVWSFGLVMWEMFTRGLDPFCNIRNEDLSIQNILTAVENMEKPNEMTPKIFEIVKMCLEKDPDDRPSFDYVRKRIRMALNEESDSPDDEHKNKAKGEAIRSDQFSFSMEQGPFSSNTTTITMPNENPSTSDQNSAYSPLIFE